MDLDGDGILDIISGSWSAERQGRQIIRAGMLFIFRGREDGTFGPRENLKFATGENIGIGNTSTAFAVDWTGNGQKDLLVGNHYGEVYLIPCGDEPMQFQEQVRLTWGDGELVNTTGSPAYSHPIAADWNGNGRLDLILGHGDGEVAWYPNEGKAENDWPKLGAPRRLIPPGTRSSDGSLPGGRAKICVVDFNGNGRLDLMVGDWGVFRQPPEDLSDEDRAERDKLQEEQNEVSQAFHRLHRQIESDILKELGVENRQAMTEEQAAEYRTRFTRATRENQEYARLQQENRRLVQALTRFLGPPVMGGHVWVYERKPAVTSEETQ